MHNEASDVAKHAKVFFYRKKKPSLDIKSTYEGLVVDSCYISIPMVLEPSFCDPPSDLSHAIQHLAAPTGPNSPHLP